MMSQDDRGPGRFSMLAAVRHMGSFVLFLYAYNAIDWFCVINLYHKTLFGTTCSFAVRFHLHRGIGDYSLVYSRYQNTGNQTP